MKSRDRFRIPPAVTHVLIAWVCAIISANWQCAISQTVISDSLMNHPHVRLLHAKLESAYAKHSLAMLDRVLETWRQDPNLKSSPGGSSISDTVSELYSVFQAYADTTFEIKSPYIVLPTSMTYSVDDSLMSDVPQSSSQFIDKEGVRSLRDPWLMFRNVRRLNVADFRPKYRSGKSRVLYLEAKYEAALNLFLQPSEIESADSIQLYAAEVDKRAAFLRKRFPVLRGHNGFYFYFGPKPMCERVALSKDLKYAEILSSSGDLSGSVEAFIKTQKGWIYFRTVSPTWVQ